MELSPATNHNSVPINNERPELDDEIYFLKNRKDYYEVVYEPHYCILRHIFCVDDRDYTAFELKMLKLLLLNDLRKNFLSKIKDEELKNLLEENIIKSRINCMRYLNMFSYDIERTLNNFEKFAVLIKRLKLNANYFKTNEKVIIDKKILNLCGMDKKRRPIIAVNLNLLLGYNQFESSKLLQSIIISINNFIETELIPGVSEQFIIFLDFTNVSQTDLPQNYPKLIKLFQYLYPSRFYKIYVSVSAKSMEIYLIIGQFLCEFNKKRISIYNMKNKDLTLQIKNDSLNKLVNNFSTIKNNVELENSFEVNYEQDVQEIIFAESQDLEKIKIDSNFVSKDSKASILPSKCGTNNQFNFETDCNTNSNLETFSYARNLDFSSNLKIDRYNTFILSNPPTPNRVFELKNVKYNISRDNFMIANLYNKGSVDEINSFIQKTPAVARRGIESIKFEKQSETKCTDVCMIL